MSNDPNRPSVWSNPTNQPFARRSVASIFLLVAVLIGLGYFVFIWFFSSVDVDEVSQTTTNLQMPENRYAEGSTRGGVYDFFYKMFGGIEDGLDENPHNLKNVEHINAMNLDTDDLMQEGDDTVSSISPKAIARSLVKNIDDGYRHSVYDIIGGEVRGVQGDKAGQVHDIIINKETGIAKTIIMKEDGKSYYDRDLAALRFKNIKRLSADGDIQMVVTEDQMEDKPDFDYSIINGGGYISLRDLRKGKLLDFEGNVAGEVDAVIYNNSEVQKIYFALRPALNPSDDKPLTFGVPYSAINVVQNTDGYDVKLTKEQTASLAELLFGSEE